MMNANRSSFKLSMIALTLGMPLVCGVRIWGQEAAPDSKDKVQVTGLPDDWTYHHLVFSNPGTEEEAIRNGTHERWLKIHNDPRYIIQQLKRGSPAKGLAAEDATHALPPKKPAPPPPPPPKKPAPKGSIEKDWSESLGTTGAPGQVAYPAKWSFNTGTASCANDFVIYPTGGVGASNQATLIAYYNLYGGCSGTVPTVDWAYNTGTNSYVGLASVFSLNGNQVAFLQNSTTSVAASLALLTFPLTPPGTGTVTSPATPTSVLPSAYYGCAAPCMTSITLNGSPYDTQSSPYYDYLTDSLYVGDSGGKLHKFNPVFNGTPVEITSSWPVQLKNTSNDTDEVESPVYDVSSGYVFVGTESGFFYSVGTGNQGTTSGAIHAYSSQLDVDLGIADAPLVDSTAGMVYVFAGRNQFAKNAVYQFATTFTTGASPGVATLGSYGNFRQYAGTFDNTYYTSSSPSSPSGSLYVCGTGSEEAPLYQVAINSNVMGTVVTGPSLSELGTCSPVTEFYNTAIGVDFLFLSVSRSLEGGCSPSNGCVMSFNVTSPSSFSSSLTPSGTQNLSTVGAESGTPTSGIIVDNGVSTPAGTSQIYFDTLDLSGTTPCTGICAVQASQTAP